jgi:hypothetical protein
VGESCYSREQLADIATLAADDPRRAHLESCPRCRDRLAAYQEWLARGPQPGLASRFRALRNLPRLRAALAVAAGLLLIAGLPAVISRHHEEAPPPQAQEQAPAEEDAVLACQAVPHADGTIRFSWRPIAGAELYRLEFFDADLSELSHLATRSDSVLVLDPQMLPQDVDVSAIAFWRLGAVARSDMILQSPLQTFPGATPQESP